MTARRARPGGAFSGRARGLGMSSEEVVAGKERRTFIELATGRTRRGVHELEYDVWMLIDLSSSREDARDKIKPVLGQAYLQRRNDATISTQHLE